ncbi:MAG: rhodanese-like domain-containing protein [Planctomycetota bacterium]|jgi:rhodanese-related sulfurtransferase|nr:rhodanese-like domain-containing protein [Planctomycetota bacterium]MDP6762906.1 rhodanese-like domain-containing protein [Planctomycetota bacterium]MDP6988632.1 rhodanese-like domain-containing protein [Planctomycetota bacterium]
MSHETLEPSDAHERIQREQGWHCLDVRTPEEFAAGHLPGAWNVPFGFKSPGGLVANPEFLEAIERLFGKQARMVVY